MSHSVAYLPPQSEQAKRSEQDALMNRLIARKIMGWAEDEQHEGTIAFRFLSTNALTLTPAQSTWSCQECGANGLFDNTLLLPSVWRHIRHAPNYVSDPALMMELLARLRQWPPERQRLFTSQLYQEIIKTMDASGELARDNLEVGARYWGFLLYLEPRAVCQAALFAVEMDIPDSVNTPEEQEQAQ